MCTVTALRKSEGLLVVTMNRDELRTRPAEIPPTLRNPEPPGISWLAPIDSASTGTWIGVNEFGLIACILNGYATSDEKRKLSVTPPTSRGIIVPEVLQRGTMESASKWLQNEFNAAGFLSFTLLIFSNEETLCCRWSGEGELTFEHSDIILEHWSSSSWNTTEVLEFREELFRHWSAREMEFTNQIPNYNLMSISGKAEWSPLMEREKSATRSITSVKVSRAKSSALMRYWDNPEHAFEGAPKKVRLALRPTLSERKL